MMHIAIIFIGFYRARGRPMQQNPAAEQESRETISIPLVWGDIDRLDTIYANHLYIIHSGGEFFLVFGEMTPMILEGRVPEHLEIKPVAKIAVSPVNMIRIANVIKEIAEVSLPQAQMEEDA
jgi:hypothetical protein